MSKIIPSSNTLGFLYVQVAIPLSLQRRVEGLLQEHCDRIRLSSGKASEISKDAKSIDEVKDVNVDECEDSYLDGSMMEKVLQRRSLRMRNMQRAWQVIKISSTLNCPTPRFPISRTCKFE